MSEHPSQVELNPYVAPESYGRQTQASANQPASTHLSPLSAGLVAWASTGIAGGVFGFGIFGFVGAAFGLFIAGAAAAPVTAVIFVVLRIVCPAGVSRKMAVIASALCGLTTGFGSTVSLFGNDSMPYAAIAGIVGGIVPAIGVGLMSFSKYSYRQPDVPPAVWSDLEPQLSEVDVETDWNKIAWRSGKKERRP